MGRVLLLSHRADEANALADDCADQPLLFAVVVDNAACGDWVSRLNLTALGDKSSARLLFGGSYSAACGEKERSYSVLGHSQYVHALLTLLWGELGGAFAGGVRDAETPAGAQKLLAYQTQTLAEIVRDINNTDLPAKM